MAVGMFGNLPDLEFTGGVSYRNVRWSTLYLFFFFSVYRACVGQPERTSSRVKMLPPSFDEHAHQWVTCTSDGNN